MYGEAQARVIEAVPPLLARVRLVPPDATTIELLLEYEVMQTAGRMYYALCEVEAADKGEKVTQQKTRTSKSVVVPWRFPEWERDARRVGLTTTRIRTTCMRLYLSQALEQGVASGIA